MTIEILVIPSEAEGRVEESIRLASLAQDKPVEPGRVRAGRVHHKP